MRSSVPSQLQSSKSSYTVERGGRSLGIARHWQPVLRMYISPFTTSRTFTVRLLPPRLPGRMSGSTWLHSSSVKSLGYRSLLRSYRARFSIVHIGGLSTTQAAILASQTLDPIQYVPEQALSIADRPSPVLWRAAAASRPRRASPAGPGGSTRPRRHSPPPSRGGEPPSRSGGRASFFERVLRVRAGDPGHGPPPADPQPLKRVPDGL